MQLIYILLILCAAMAVIKVVVMALLIVFGMGLLYSTARHPKETIGFILMLITVSLVEHHPWAAGVGLIATAIASAMGRVRIDDG